MHSHTQKQVCDVQRDTWKDYLFTLVLIAVYFLFRRLCRNDELKLKRPLLLWLGVVSPLTQSSWRCMRAWSLLESLWHQITSPKRDGSNRYFGFVSYSGGAISHLCLVPLAKIFRFKYKYLYIEKVSRSFFGWYFICLFIFPSTQNFNPKNPKNDKTEIAACKHPVSSQFF